MPIDHRSGAGATLAPVDLAELQAHVAAFALDPHAAIIAATDAAALQRLADRDPPLAERLAESRQRAHALAVEAFVTGDEDSIEMAMYLLDWCTPSTVVQVARMAETDTQRWLLAEYLLGRGADALDAPDAEVLAGLDGWQIERLQELMHAIVRGEPRPAAYRETTSAPAAQPPRGTAVNLRETVIVHGTYAKSATWWREQPGTRNFWAYIRGFCPALYGTGHEFTWSGLNTDSDREQGARDFIDWWNGEGAPPQLQVIAHSHGCNVVYRACAMEPKLAVANLVALGNPVRIEYPPPVGAARIQRIHNVYSEFDNTQWLGSLGGQRGEGRTLGDGDHIANHHVPWEDPRTQQVRVGHGDLHEEGAWQGNRLPARTLL